MEIKEVIKESIDGLKSTIEAGLDAKTKTIVEAAIKGLEADLKAAKEAGEDVKGLKTQVEELKTSLANALLALRNAPAADAGKPKSFARHIFDGITGMKDALTKWASGEAKGAKAPLDVKAVQDMTTTTNLSGAIPITYRNEIVGLPFEMVHFRSLVAVTPSATDSYHFYRFLQGEGAIDYQGGENNVKPQIDQDLQEVSITLDYLAGWLRISKKMLRNFPALQSMLSRWLPEQYYNAEDAKAYAALKASATGVPSTDGNVLDRIIRTMAIQKQAKYAVTGIVVNGITWGEILTIKATGSGEYNTPGVVTISPTGQVLILGVPVFTASWVEDNIAIVGDWRMFEIIQSEALSLNFYEQDGINVRENKVTALIEASIGFADLQPKAFAFVDVTPAE